jgi:DNA-binding transcriptional MerR regulator
VADAVFRKIGEVAEILGTRPHVIRYWEQELPLKLSDRNRGGQRVYSAEDVDKLARVKFLVVDQGVSVRKLRRIIQTEGLPPRAEATSNEAVDGPAAGPSIREIVEELRAIQRLLGGA